MPHSFSVCDFTLCLHLKFAAKFVDILLACVMHLVLFLFYLLVFYFFFFLHHNVSAANLPRVRNPVKLLFSSFQLLS